MVSHPMRECKEERHTIVAHMSPLWALVNLLSLHIQWMNIVVGWRHTWEVSNALCVVIITDVLGCGYDQGEHLSLTHFFSHQT